MEVYTNHELLEKRAKYAKWGSYVGFGALFLGLMTTSRSPILAYLFLVIGLLGASVGSYMTNRYVREPRADQTLEDALGQLDKRYALYNYYLSSDHVVASHHGLTILKPRGQKGTVIYEEGGWRHKAGWRRLLQLFGEPALGKPHKEVEEEVGWLKEWVDQVMEEDIPVNGVIVFTDPEVHLHVEDDDAFPIMVLDDLPRYMQQDLKEQPTIRTATQTKLRSLLDGVIRQS
ncbi:MAG: hypothetical protein U9R48_06400 [Chloroflexota bacterium]|nr:hypothetical protein [Chloroflexota bacterium]